MTDSEASEFVRMMDDFDKLLIERPELTRRRNLAAAQLRKMLGREKGQCTWCGEPVKGARTRWHQACLEQFFERCQSQSAARLCGKRDNGICQLCGRDTEKSRRVWKAFHSRHGTYGVDEYDREVLRLLGHARSGLGEVDHIIPVCEGGGLCRLTNLRWICGACHLDETKKLAARRADARRPQTRYRQACLFTER